MKNSPESTIDKQLSGRIDRGPDALLVDEILRPRFDFELALLLSEYLHIEQAMLTEYVRMDIMTVADAQRIAQLLVEITPAKMAAQAASSMTDVAFAIEMIVLQQLNPPVPRWHVDRSRNDLQACAQLMGGRWQLLEVAGELAALTTTALAIAADTTRVPMPGHTHYQAAQIITPGFYFTALVDQVLQSLQQLLVIYDLINLCPLGAGALSGQDLPWDRGRLAQMLGFSGVQTHALVSVASRHWTLRISAELAILGVTLSRFATDLLLWGSSGYRYIVLPDQLAGISSAMPQKKNFPVLERIRGRTAHMTALFSDLAMGQRSTPFTNLVEVSKEASANFLRQLESTRSTLRLFSTVLKHLTFHEDRLLALCRDEFYGGFQLANALCLSYGIPYRRAQVLAGRYILAALEHGMTPLNVEPALLTGLCAAEGYQVQMDREALQTIFSVETNLEDKRSAGSTNPAAVEALLEAQQAKFKTLVAGWEKRKQDLETVPGRLCTALDFT